MTPMKPAPRLKRVLARPIIQAGIERQIGETVELRPDQVERLEPEGYFEAAASDEAAASASAKQGSKSK